MCSHSLRQSVVVTLCNSVALLICLCVCCLVPVPMWERTGLVESQVAAAHPRCIISDGTSGGTKICLIVSESNILAVPSSKTLTSVIACASVGFELAGSTLSTLRDDTCCFRAALDHLNLVLTTIIVHRRIFCIVPRFVSSCPWFSTESVRCDSILESHGVDDAVRTSTVRRRLLPREQPSGAVLQDCVCGGLAGSEEEAKRPVRNSSRAQALLTKILKSNSSSSTGPRGNWVARPSNRSQPQTFVPLTVHR